MGWKVPVLFGQRGREPYWKKVYNTETANLIGYWPMDEVPASQEYLTFNGTSTKIDCGSDATLDDLHDDEFTVDFWVYINNDSNQMYFAGTRSGNTGWSTRIDGSGSIYHYIYDNAAGSKYAATSSTSMVGNWVHVAAHYNDAGDRKPSIAINGTWARGSTAMTDPIASDAANSLVLGATLASSLEIDGNLGWVRISDNDRFDGATPTNFTAPARTTIPTVDANTVSLWPMNEGYGSVAGDIGGNDNDGTITDGDWGAYPAADNAEGTAARDGAYTGVTLGQNQSPFTAPLFDGVNDFNNIYSASLAGAFSGAAGTVMCWAKVSGSGVWSDSTTRYVLVLRVDANNYIYLRRESVNDRMGWQYSADGNLEQILKSSVTTTGWMNLAMTWDKAGSGNMQSYYNGAAEGAAQAIAGTWAGSPAENTTRIGAFNATPDNPWDGYLAHCAVWTKALSAAQILDLYNGAGV